MLILEARGVTYFVFAQQWKVKDDLQRLSVSSHDNELTDTSVEGFGGFVSTLLDLLDAGTLFNNSHDFGTKFVVGKWGSSL